MGIRNWSTTASANNNSPPDGWPEGMMPSAVNNTAREMMATLRAWYEDPGWIDYGNTPTRIDNDTFTVATDLTARYAVGRRVKLVGATTGYATIASSSYGAPDTTVNVTMDSGNVPTSLVTVSLGLEQATGPILPYVVRTAAEIAAGVTPVNYAYEPGNLLRYGADFSGAVNSAAALQAAFDQYEIGGAPVYAPSGTYRVDSAVSYVTSSNSPGLKLRGDGIRKTIFDNRVASGPMIFIDGGNTSAFQYGGELRHFSITTTTSPSTSDGIRFRAQWGLEIADIGVSDLTGDGIRGSATADPDSTSYFHILRCFIEDNAAVGIDLEDTGPTIVLGTIDGCHIQRNTTAGIRCAGQLMRIIKNGIGDNGYGIRVIIAGATAPRNLYIADNEFQSNVTAHIALDSGFCIDGGRNHYNSDDSAGAFRPPVAVDIGSAGNAVTHVKLSRDIIRIQNRGANPHTVFQIGANASYVTIDNPFFSALDGSTKYTNSGTDTIIVEDNQQQIIRIGGIISPAQITANTNDYAPTGFSTAAVLRLSSDAPRNITGLAAGTSAREVRILNIGAQDIVLTNNDAASSAANRFLLGANVTLNPSEGIVIWYDATSGGWRSFATHT